MQESGKDSGKKETIRQHKKNKEYCGEGDTLKF